MYIKIYWYLAYYYGSVINRWRKRTLPKAVFIERSVIYGDRIVGFFENINIVLHKTQRVRIYIKNIGVDFLLVDKKD